MESSENKNSVAQALEDSYNIAIFPSKVAGDDAFAAALGLYLMLKKEGKVVSFVHQGEAPEAFKDLISKEEIISEPSQRELVVSIDYSNTPASKVTYHTQGDVLYLKLVPINKDFDLNNIQALVRGYDFDLIITVGAQVLQDFGPTYNQLAEEFSKATVINLDNTDRNQRFGRINVVDSLMDSLSLLVLNNASKWGLGFDSKSAKALLKGVTYRAVN